MQVCIFASKIFGGTFVFSKKFIKSSSAFGVLLQSQSMVSSAVCLPYVNDSSKILIPENIINAINETVKIYNTLSKCEKNIPGGVCYCKASEKAREVERMVEESGLRNDIYLPWEDYSSYDDTFLNLSYNEDLDGNEKVRYHPHGCRWLPKLFVDLWNEEVGLTHLIRASRRSLRRKFCSSAETVCCTKIEIAEGYSPEEMTDYAKREIVVACHERELVRKELVNYVEEYKLNFDNTLVRGRVLFFLLRYSSNYAWLYAQNIFFNSMKIFDQLNKSLFRKVFIDAAKKSVLKLSPSLEKDENTNVNTRVFKDY